LRQGFWNHFPVAALVGVVIALEMAAVLLPGFNLTDAPIADAAALKLGNTKLLGIEVYTKYLYPLQIAAVLLLVAIIAAITLTLRQRKDSRSQKPVGTGEGRARPTACGSSSSRRRSSRRRRRLHPPATPTPRGRPQETRNEPRSDHARPLPVARRHLVRAVDHRHLPEPQET